MMEEKALLAPGGPVTQESAAVRVLITYVNKLHGLPVPESDADLPAFYRLGSGLCRVARQQKKGCVQRDHTHQLFLPCGAKARRALQAPQDILSSQRGQS